MGQAGSQSRMCSLWSTDDHCVSNQLIEGNKPSPHPPVDTAHNHTSTRRPHNHTSSTRGQGPRDRGDSTIEGHPSPWVPHWASNERLTHTHTQPSHDSSPSESAVQFETEQTALDTPDDAHERSEVGSPAPGSSSEEALDSPRAASPEAKVGEVDEESAYEDAEECMLVDTLSPQRTTPSLQDTDSSSDPLVSLFSALDVYHTGPLSHKHTDNASRAPPPRPKSSSQRKGHVVCALGWVTPGMCDADHPQAAKLVKQDVLVPTDVVCLQLLRDAGVKQVYVRIECCAQRGQLPDLDLTHRHVDRHGHSRVHEVKSRGHSGRGELESQGRDLTETVSFQSTDKPVTEMRWDEQASKRSPGDPMAPTFHRFLCDGVARCGRVEHDVRVRVWDALGQYKRALCEGVVTLRAGQFLPCKAPVLLNGAIPMRVHLGVKMQSRRKLASRARGSIRSVNRGRSRRSVSRGMK